MATEITTAQARELINSHLPENLPAPSLRAFTSGRRVSYERFNAELDMLFSEAGFDAYDDLKTVQAYAENTSDPVWTDLDTGSGDS